ncbi:MAG TPA: ABC transporter ATP-binding protein [Steroidobacteraceae bacterium]
MSEIAVRVRNLSKVYRLYHRPIGRVFAALGLPTGHLVAYRERVALDRVSFEIAKGERVAIVGRNGAGKTTLLKLIAGVSQPSAGTLAVDGNAHVLMDVGTGFHPDFTGRENVRGYMAQMGRTGAAAEKAVEEIIDFAEIGEYIDQPVRTYSAGMAMRLMFAASISIEPNVLLLDEVLAVGDAYFTHKSFDRIRDVCARGATLLLVTHDLYRASALCDRMIWLDRGRIMMDDRSVVVLNAFEASIRDEEEQRLRRRNLALDMGGHVVATPSPDANCWYGELRGRDGHPPQTDVFISHIEFAAEGRTLARLDMRAEVRSEGSCLLLGPGESNWGPVGEKAGRIARAFLPYGSIYHKLPFLLRPANATNALAAGCLEVEAGIWAASAEPLELRLADESGDGQLACTIATVSPGAWCDVRSRLAPASPRLDGTGRFGQRRMEITEVRFLDELRHETFIFETGAGMRVRLRYRINDPGFDQTPTLIVAFQKDGYLRTHRFWTDRIRISAAAGREGELEITAAPLLMAPGTYRVTVSVFEEGYFARGVPREFYTVSDRVCDVHARAYEIVVTAAADQPLCNDVLFQHPSEWRLVVRPDRDEGQPVGDVVRDGQRRR